MFKHLFNIGINTLVTLLLFLNFSSFHNFYLRTIKGNAVVKIIRPGGGGGTGFGIEYEGNKYIITNSHICDIQSFRGDDLIILEEQGKRAKVQIIKQYKGHDLCIIKHVLNVPTLSLGGAPKLGDAMYIVGHPALQPKTLTSGEYVGHEILNVIMDADRDEFLLRCKSQFKVVYNPYDANYYCIGTFKSTISTATILGGSSGSPVMNSWGNVIGVVFAGGLHSNNWAKIVPLDFIEKFMYTYHKELKEKNETIKN